MDELYRQRRVPMRYEERCRLRRLELDAAVEELIEACAAVGGVLAIYAYGSYARGTVGAHSDIDALIVRDTALPRVRREDNIRARLAAPVGFDLLVVQPYEFSHVMPRNPMGRHILSEAKLLHRIEPVTSRER